MIDLQTGLRGYVLTSRPAFLAPYGAAVATYPALMSRLAALTAGERAQHARALRIRAVIDSYVRDWARPQIGLVRSGRPAAARRATATGEGNRRIAALRGQFAAFLAAEQRQAAAGDERVRVLGSLVFWFGDAGPWSVRSAIAIPAIGPSGILVIGEFFAGHDLGDEPEVADTLVSMAALTAQFIERTIAAREAERAKDEFVATVAHDLRAPITAMQGWLDILLAGKPGPLTDRQRDALGTVRRNSARLVRLADDLTTARQIEADGLSLNLAEVDVADVARESWDLMAAQATAKGIALTLDAPGAVVVRGDRARLIQLLDNLVTNAVKYTPDDGQVRIAVAAEDGTCLVSVADTGIGIPEQERGHLFERFYRASSATARGIQGTGLGLAICKAIAQAHRGSIYLAASDEPGSRFVVELPLADGAG